MSKRVSRQSDEDPNIRLEIFVDNQDDVYITIKEGGLTKGEVRFTVGGGGGSRSVNTGLAIKRHLIPAMERDEQGLLPKFSFEEVE